MADLGKVQIPANAMIPQGHTLGEGSRPTPPLRLASLGGADECARPYANKGRIAFVIRVRFAV
jgi:hypothetical protein